MVTNSRVSVRNLSANGDTLGSLTTTYERVSKSPGGGVAPRVSTVTKASFKAYADIDTEPTEAAMANGQTCVAWPGNAQASGLSLRIPEVSRATHTASTYRVYQPSEVIGSTTPQGVAPAATIRPWPFFRSPMPTWPMATWPCSTTLRFRWKPANAWA